MAKHDDHLLLMHIIAVLFSLAVLAERLIGDPPHVRRRVLVFLRPAEAVARGLLAGERSGRYLRGLPCPAPLDGDGPQDALRLALCFRALAVALGAVLAQFPLSGASPVEARKPWHQRSRLALHPFAFAPAIVPDTS